MHVSAMVDQTDIFVNNYSRIPALVNDAVDEFEHAFYARNN